MSEGGSVVRALRGLRFHAPGLAVVLAVAAAPFALAALRGETPFFLDLADHWFPYRLHAWEARQQGELAHWCRRSFCGMPFLPQLEAALCYPPHWVLDLVHPAQTLLAQLVGHRFVLGALLYAVLVARGASRTAAALGGALLVASGTSMVAVSQLAHLRTLAWLPLLLLGATRLAQGRRLEGTLWTALGTALPAVAGYPAFLQRASFVLPAILLLDPAWPRGAAEWRERAGRFAGAAAGAALGAALAAAQLLPSMAFTGESQRQLGLDPALLDHLRVEPSEALAMLVPRLDTDGGIVKQGFAYLGLLPIALAAFAVVRRRPGAVAFAAATGVALVASMGRAVPLVGDALASLPVLDSFRNPGQYLVGWVLVVPVLAAIGLDAWIERPPAPRETAIAFGGTFALAAAATLVPAPLDDPGSRTRAAIGLAGLAAGAFLAWVPLRFAAAALVAACLADAASFQFNYPTKSGRARRTDTLRAPDAPFGAVARRHAETQRPGVPRIITSDAVFNWENHGWAAGLDSVRGLHSLVPLRALDLHRILQEGAPFERRPPAEPLYAYGPTRVLDSPRIDLLALEYAVGFRTQPGPAWRPVAAGVWERDAAPEARFAERVFPCAPAPRDARATGEDWRRLLDPSFDPLRDALVEGDGGGGPQVVTPAPGSVRIVEVRTNAVRMDADVAAAGPATLVWSQTHDPGWSVTVDGAPAPVRRANWAHMATEVPPGRHVVEWRYESPGWGTGLRISLAALVVFGVLALSARARRVAA